MHLSGSVSPPYVGRCEVSYADILLLEAHNAHESPRPKASGKFICLVKTPRKATRIASSRAQHWVERRRPFQVPRRIAATGLPSWLFNWITVCQSIR